MGLDMTLYRFQHITKFGEPCAYEALHKMLGEPSIPKYYQMFTVRIPIFYWRKANAIHAWFVKNVQDGADDCREYPVTRSQLGRLRSICEQVMHVAETQPGKVHVSTTISHGKILKNYEDGLTITNPEEVAALLPTESGFFFGSTDYDGYYLDKVVRTFEGLTNILEHKDYHDFAYQSSW